MDQGRGRYANHTGNKVCHKPKYILRGVHRSGLLRCSLHWASVLISSCAAPVFVFIVQANMGDQLNLCLMAAEMFRAPLETSLPFPQVLMCFRSNPLLLASSSRMYSYDFTSSQYESRMLSFPGVSTSPTPTLPRSVGIFRPHAYTEASTDVSLACLNRSRNPHCSATPLQPAPPRSSQFQHIRCTASLRLRIVHARNTGRSRVGRCGPLGGRTQALCLRSFRFFDACARSAICGWPREGSVSSSVNRRACGSPLA